MAVQQLSFSVMSRLMWISKLVDSVSFNSVWIEHFEIVSSDHDGDNPILLFLYLYRVLYTHTQSNGSGKFKWKYFSTMRFMWFRIRLQPTFLNNKFIILIVIRFANVCHVTVKSANQGICKTHSATYSYRWLAIGCSISKSNKSTCFDAAINVCASVTVDGRMCYVTWFRICYRSFFCVVLRFVFHTHTHTHIQFMCASSIKVWFHEDKLQLRAYKIYCRKSNINFKIHQLYWSIRQKVGLKMVWMCVCALFPLYSTSLARSASTSSRA